MLCKWSEGSEFIYRVAGYGSLIEINGLYIGCQGSKYFVMF